MPLFHQFFRTAVSCYVLLIFSSFCSGETYISQSSSEGGESVHESEFSPASEFNELSSGRYEKGNFREFDNVHVNSEPVSGGMDINQTSNENAEKEHRFDAIFEKVKDEDRFVERLDSSSFFTLPVGVSMADGAFSLIVYESSVHSDHALFNAFLHITNPLDGRTIRFHAKDVRYSFTGGVETFRLELMNQVSTGLFQGASLKWKAGSYAEWGCKGLDHVGLSGNLALDSSRFERIDPYSGETRGAINIDFFTTFSDLNGIILDISIPTFKLKGFDEVYFEFNNALLDCSDRRNSPHFTLPSDYPGGFNGEMEPLWRGIFVNEATVFLSSKFNREDQETPVSFTANDLLIDDNGFTGLMTARGILSSQSGTIGNWPFSIDELSLEFLAGSFQSFGFNGELRFPGSDTFIGYDAFLDEAGSYYFGVSPADDVDFNVFSATLELESTSRIDVFVDEGEFKPTAVLDGYLSFRCGKQDADNKMVSVPGVEFQGMRISAISPHFDVNYLALDGRGTSSLAQFPLTINNIAYAKYGDLSGFSFDVKANLSPVDGCAIKGEGSFSVLADLSGEEWKYKRVDVGGFSVDSEKEGAFKFHGALEFFDDDPTYGNGFYGSLEAVFGGTFGSEGDTKLEVAGMFGRGDYGRYYFVDAFLALGGTTGVPAGPFILNGFGGGLSYGMKRTQEGGTSGGVAVSSLSGVQYLPDRHSGLGISAAVQAGIVNESMLKSKLHFGINFSRHGGIEKIRFKGEAIMLGSIPGLSADEMKALSGKVAGGGDVALGTTPPMKAEVRILKDYRQNTFDADMEVWLNIAGAIRGVGRNNRAGWATFHHEPGQWHLYVGTPTDPVGLDFIGLAESRSYFMAGHDLPSAMLMNDKVLDILNMSQQDFNGQRKENDLIKGDGVAFGSHLDISTGDITFLIFYGAFDLGAGFDAMLLDYGEHARCVGRTGQPGIDGWFAKGQAYGYFAGNIGINVKVFSSKKKFDIINVQTAAALRLEGPNPTWMKGVVGGSYKILGGMVKGNCSFEVTAGEKCELKTGPEELSDMTIIGGLTPTEGADDVGIFTLPQAVFNMPVDKKLKISEDENLTQEFRVNLKEYSVSRNGEKQEGDIEWNSEKNTLAFTPSTIFDPETEYKVTVKVSFDEKINGRWQQYKDDNGELYVESKEMNFETGELPDEIPSEYVDVTYPVDRMTNFYKSEHPTAYIDFKSDLAPFFEEVGGWEQKARWFPVNGGTPIYTDFTYKPGDGEVVSEVPAGLVHKTMYRFELVNIPLSDNNDVDRNVSEQADRAVAQNDTSYTDVTNRQAEGVISEQEEKVFYSIDFRSSKYDEFLDKIPADELDVRFLFNYGVGIDFPGVTIKNDELFDGYEILGGDGFGPLVRTSAQLSGADWYRKHIYPLLYEDYPWHNKVVVERDESEYGIPPQHPVDIWQIDFGYTLTDSDIETGTLSNESQIAHFLYVLPLVWDKDFSDLRSNVARYVENGKTDKMKELLRRDLAPQVDKGTYPIKLEYVLPGKDEVTSSGIVDMNNPFDVEQVETLSK